MINNSTTLYNAYLDLSNDITPDIYFKNLFSEIKDEYTQDGFSPLIDYLLEDKPSVDVLILSVMYSLIDSFSNVETITPIQYIPGSIKTPFKETAWNTIVYKKLQLIEIDAEILKELHKLKELGHDIHKSYVESLLKKAESLSDEKAEPAIENQPANENEPVVPVECGIQSNHDIQNQQNTEVIPAAQNPEQNTVIPTCVQVNPDPKQIEELVNKKVSAQVDDYIKSSKQAVETRLSQALKECREDYNAKIEEFKKQYPEIISIEQKHSEMVTYSSAVQGEISKVYNELENIQQNLYEKLRAWQISLYPRELKPIAQCYISMYKNSISTNKLLASIIASGASEAMPKDDYDRLTRLKRNLEIICSRFEIALLGLQIKVYTPNAGDSFDDILHEVYGMEEEEYIAPGAVISRCVTPGLLRENAFGSEPDILIPAEVEIK